MLQRIIYNTIIALLVLICISLIGCKKYLDVKPNQTLVVPNKIQDYQSLLDDWFFINQRDPYASEVSADDYYLGNSDYANLNEYERRMYIWGDNIFQPGSNNNWALLYSHIYRTNIVLENIDKVNHGPNDNIQWNNTKGHALFIRAKAYLQLANIFTLAYDDQSASKDLGLPLRLSSDFNQHILRSSNEETYKRIILDLNNAIPLLPITPLHCLRPSRAAAYGLLARAYLSMRKYDSCYKYADLCLSLKKDLLNYNSKGSGIDPQTDHPFTRFNMEVIFDSNIPYPAPLYVGNVDSTLSKLYQENDLRKTLFFSSQAIQIFKGNYEGYDNLFDGIATDEIFLMRAECYARTNNIVAAMNDLNTLSKNRYLPDFAPYNFTDAQDALSKVLIERRKELVYRGLRWMDIKRLNKEGADIILKRTIAGVDYILPANSPRYALPIPTDVISISGISQNPR